MNELNLNAIELSDAELDTVAGGTIAIGDINSYASGALNTFFQKDLAVAQTTQAGPGGSTTVSVTKLSEVSSGAGQFIFVG